MSHHTGKSRRTAIATTLLTLCLALLVACGGSDNNSGSNTGNNSGGNPGSANTGNGGGSNSSAAGYVYVGNGNGTISAFGISASDGNLTTVSGSPFSSGGQVLDLALANNTLVNTNAANGVTTWSVNSSNGVLTQGSTTQVTGATWLAGADNNIYVSSPTTGIYAFTASNGTLSQVGSPASVASLCQDCQPGRLEARAGFLYVMYNGFRDVYGFAALPRGGNGALGQAHSFGGVNNSTFNALDEAVAPNNQFLYESWETSNAINVYRIDPSSGGATLVKADAATAGEEGQDALVSRDGRFLLVLNNVSNNISVFSINASTGLPTAVSGSPFPTGSRPVKMQFDSTGKYLYVICSAQGTADLFGYRMDSNSGSLTQVAHQSIGGDPRAIVVK